MLAAAASRPFINVPETSPWSISANASSRSCSGAAAARAENAAARFFRQGCCQLLRETCHRARLSQSLRAIHDDQPSVMLTSRTALNQSSQAAASNGPPSASISVSAKRVRASSPAVDAKIRRYAPMQENADSHVITFSESKLFDLKTTKPGPPSEATQGSSKDLGFAPRVILFTLSTQRCHPSASRAIPSGIRIAFTRAPLENCASAKTTPKKSVIARNADFTVIVFLISTISAGRTGVPVHVISGRSCREREPARFQHKSTKTLPSANRRSADSGTQTEIFLSSSMHFSTEARKLSITSCS